MTVYKRDTDKAETLICWENVVIEMNIADYTQLENLMGSLNNEIPVSFAPLNQVINADDTC